VIDGRVQSAPWIRAEITGGKGVIEGIFSDREAQELASRLNNAAK
jgi:preprotein translocase subunit SecD